MAVARARQSERERWMSMAGVEADASADVHSLLANIRALLFFYPRNFNATIGKEDAACFRNIVHQIMAKNHANKLALWQRVLIDTRERGDAETEHVFVRQLRQLARIAWRTLMHWQRGEDEQYSQLLMEWLRDVVVFKSDELSTVNDARICILNYFRENHYIRDVRRMLLDNDADALGASESSVIRAQFIMEMALMGCSTDDLATPHPDAIIDELLTVPWLSSRLPYQVLAIVESRLPFIAILESLAQREEVVVVASGHIGDDGQSPALALLANLLDFGASRVDTMDGNMVV